MTSENKEHTGKHKTGTPAQRRGRAEKFTEEERTQRIERFIIFLVVMAALSFLATAYLSMT